MRPDSESTQNSESETCIVLPTGLKMSRGGAKNFFVGKLILRTMALAVFRLKTSFVRYVEKTNIFSKIYVHSYIGQKR